MQEKQKVLIVDDDECSRFLMERALGKEYDIRSVGSGESCLEAINEFIPDVFLLDVFMPGGMDGFELCQEIRSQDLFDNSLIIFLSGLEEQEKKVYGYQVGADDFMSKEFGVRLLKEKLDSQRIRIKALNDAIPMTNGSEIALVAQFLECINDAENYDALAGQVIEICKAFDVNAVIQIRIEKSMINLSTTGEVNTLETEFMYASRDANRICKFGKRSLFNFGEASLLVRVIPEDADKFARYRAHLASVMNGVETRMQSFHSEL